ncbi:MAG: hypothetical protein J6M16_09805 [Clostridia bacterium]|nr:hypothetical protein [Clostridia bacterium]
MNRELVPFNMEKMVEITKRYEKIYTENSPRALIQIRSCKNNGIINKEVKPLNAYKFPEDRDIYLDALAENSYMYSRFHERFDDDHIVSASPWYGIADLTGFLGGKVDFTADTSYHHQICENFADFRKLSLNKENNPWVELVSGGVKYMREKWGKYIPIAFDGADGPGDVANVIRGNDLFYDVYDYPDELPELMDFCAKAVNFTLDLQRAEATEVKGGYLAGFKTWMPGKCVGQLSEDFSTMVSPSVYEKHFLHALEKTVKDSSMAMMHVHSVGEQLIPLFTSVDKIKLFELSSDPNAPRAVETFRKYKKYFRDKVVEIAPTFDELINMEDILSENRIIVWYYAENEDDAKRAIEFVNKYRSD